ncbi:MAG: response regulator transcription factor [Victivallaceae bacterium]|nr:response regulator transcription factor [Victivallaceae bacterium]
MSISIFIVDDHNIVREGLKSIIENNPDMTVVGEAGDGETALQDIRDCDVDIVMMDIEMPGISGIEATKQIVKDFNVKVLALSAYSDIRYVQKMLKAGASGYLLKECVLDELLKAIHCVAKGDIFISRRLTSDVVSDYVKRLSAIEDSPLSLLTDKETETLRLIAQGLSRQEIARKLFTTVSTVSTHRLHIMEKLEMSTTADIVKFAIREGIATLDSL